MTKLSVNVNKIATLRNARGGNLPDLLQMVQDCERFGAQGITVHPRPDERHVTRKDVYDLKSIVCTEFNIEGYPSIPFLRMIREVKPDQVTLVPDAPDAITSNNGWNIEKHLAFLTETISMLKENNIRTSIFVNPDTKSVEFAKHTGTDRIELFTEAYSKNYASSRDKAIIKYLTAAEKAHELGIGLNAGHDLNLNNLAFFNSRIPWLLEVSIGHALICDALYYGLENTIKAYLACLNTNEISRE